MASDTRGVLFIKLGISSARGPSCCTGYEVVTKSNPFDHNDIEERVYFPTVSFISQIINGNKVFQFTVIINSTVNPILVISKSKNHTGIILFLTIPSSLFIIFPERKEESLHSFFCSPNIFSVLSSFKSLLTNIVRR